MDPRDLHERWDDWCKKMEAELRRLHEQKAQSIAAKQYQELLRRLGVGS